jgi:nucleoside-diphosphate-sugar epimerase
VTLRHLPDGTPGGASVAQPHDEAELEELLSEPTSAVIEALRACRGDVVVLGAGGKMGPSLARMAQRAVDALSAPRRVIAVSRFSSPAAATRLEQQGVEVIRADLGDPDMIQRLPDAPNVIYMAGQKFGTTDAPGRTWFVNTAVPAWVAHRYRSSRIVAFSTGNVYGLVPVAGDGSREADPLEPVGEYAASCVGRERQFEYAADAYGTPVTILRLNYAVDLRYGVLVDIAAKVRRNAAVNVAMGWLNCIWQGDANAMALAALGLATSPPTILNVTGPETLAVRDLAMRFALRFGATARIEGVEAADALLSNTDKMQSLFGVPRVSADRLVEMVAAWLEDGGVTLDKATHFEERGGAF